MRSLILSLLFAAAAFAQHNQIQVLLADTDAPVTPVDMPGGGTYSSTQSVTITDATATFILYTLDGSTPACPGTGTLYTGAFNISSTSTLKAIGCNGITGGAVLTSVYTISSGPLSHISFQSTTNDGAGPSSPIDTTGATLLYASQSYYNTTVCIPQDSESNIWVPLTSATSSGTASIIGYYVLSPITSATHTFSAYAGGACYPAMTVEAWNTVTHFDQATQGGTNGTGSCQPGSGNITPGHNNSVLIASMAASTAPYTPPPSINQSFTLGDYNIGASGEAIGGAIAYLVQTTATAVNPTFSLTGGGAMTCQIAVFY